VPWSDWIRTVEVEPSLYAADFSRLGEQIEVLMQAGVRIFHFDVGDGYFVPPITMGPIVLQSIAPQIHAAGGQIDCHLMIFQPERHLEAFAQAGADSVTVHLEAAEDLPAVVAAARGHDLQVGLAFNPQSTPGAAAQAATATGVDFVLCMSIHPGYSGQEFMPDAIERIRELRGLIPEGVHIQVDGGIGPQNAREVHEAGANLLVAGTSIFGADDSSRAYRRLVEALA
jgi:ribulose-phosphate 3-epimerase